MFILTLRCIAFDGASRNNLTNWLREQSVMPDDHIVTTGGDLRLIFNDVDEFKAAATYFKQAPGSFAGRKVDLCLETSSQCQTGTRAPLDKTRSIFLEHLHPSATARELAAWFTEKGFPLTPDQIVLPERAGIRRSFGLVEMPTANLRNEVIWRLDRAVFKGSVLRMNPYKAREKKP